MFDQTFVNTRGQTRRPWTVAVSLATQTLIVAALFVAPLLRVAVLRRPEPLPVSLIPPSPNRAVRTEPRPAPHSAAAKRPIFPRDLLKARVVAPRQVDMTPDVPDLGIETSVPGAPTGATVFAMLPEVSTAPPPRTPDPVKPQPRIAPAAPIHVSAGVQSAKLLFGPHPVYPPLAKAARMSGTVRIQAVLGRDGAIRNLQVLSGPPLLIDAARKAVEQWRYQPTLLNSEPVEVITEIDVNFIIGQ